VLGNLPTNIVNSFFIGLEQVDDSKNRIKLVIAQTSPITRQLKSSLFQAYYVDGEMNFQKLFYAILLIATLGLASCTSSGVSSYGNAVTSSYAGRDNATIEAKKAKSDVRVIVKKINKSERVIKRSERKIKRLGKRKAVRTRSKLSTTIAKHRLAIKISKKSLKKAKRNSRRADTKLARAERKTKFAEKRKLAYETRQAKLEKARAERKIKSSESRSLFALASSGPIEYADYKSRRDGTFKLPAIPVKKMKKQYLRQRVNYRSREKTGTLIVDTKNRYLYLVESGGKAMRYGIGVGKSGFEWSGEAKVAWKQQWPKWTPPQEMIDRTPNLAKYGGENGMKGGLKNPLGARALYIFQNGKDTLYRLHGSPQWASIGTAASSGCIRLINQDIIDLYDRVRPGAKIIVKQG
jgi:lipoprotein-anchoring transpeptidase ErfK/SrfK